MDGFRTIERLLAEHFSTRGVKPSTMNGNLYLGVIATRVGDEEQKDGPSRKFVEVDGEAKPGVLSLTELAEDLAEALF